MNRIYVPINSCVLISFRKIIVIPKKNKFQNSRLLCGTLARDDLINAEMHEAKGAESEYHKVF